jgi:hypothetical protein
MCCATWAARARQSSKGFPRAQTAQAFQRDRLRPLFSGSRLDFFWIAAKYLVSAAQGLRPGRLQQAVQTVFTEHEGVMMQTIAEQWMQEWSPKVRQEEALAFTLRLLEKRLGSLEASTAQRLRKLSVEQLEELGLAVLDFKEAKDLTTWLRKHTK